MVNINKLKGEIIANGLTQKTVYEKIGLSRRQWLGRIEKKQFSSDEIYKICQILGKEILPIFFED